MTQLLSPPSVETSSSSSARARVASRFAQAFTTAAEEARAADEALRAAYGVISLESLEADQEAAVRAAESLIGFTQATKPDYVVQLVHRVIADHLERVERGEILKLLIMVQPRIGKSELSTVRFSGWWLGRHPNDRVLVACYGDKHAKRFGRQVRNLTESGVYQGIFPGVRPARDSRAVTDWNLADPHLGGMLSVGVGGAVTGTGASLIVIDDPVKNRKAANSPTQRDAVWDWYKDDILTRRAHDRVPIVMTMTRWHPNDLGGRVLEEEPGEWTVLRIPALAEPNDPLGREVGEVLWPEKFSRAFLEAEREKSGDFEALYQQNPLPAGGVTFERAWFTDRRYHWSDKATRNAVIGRWLSFDTAMKDEESSDYTSCAVVELLKDYRLIVREVWRAKLQFPDLPTAIEHMAVRYNRDSLLQGVIIEDKGSGTSAYQTLRVSAVPWLREMLIPFLPPGSKPYRASLVAVYAKTGCVLLPHPSDEVPWLNTFESEFFMFPAVANDDQTDAVVQAMLFLEHQLAAGLEARRTSTDAWAAG